jgi:hypothetical protein
MFDLNNIESKFRNFKIECLEKNKLIIKDHRLEKFKLTKNYKIIESEFKNQIITGSISLWLYGLLEEERKFKDVDLITSELNRILIQKEYYSGELDKRYLGYKEYKFSSGFIFKKKEIINVDFFKYDTQKFTEYDGLKIHNPLEIIKTKIELSKGFNNSFKHRNDLNTIFNS